MVSSRRMTVRQALVGSLSLAVLATGLAWSPWVAPPARAADEPIAHWTFDDGSGGVAADLAGGHDGTLEGDASWVTEGAAVGSGAIAFDGIGDGVLVPDNADLEPDSITISMWLKGDGWSFPARRSLVQKGASGCEGGSWGLEAIYSAHAPGSVFGRVDTPAINSWDGVRSVDARIMDGAWHHVAFTYDAATGLGAAYIDGVASQDAVAPFTYGLSLEDLYIGRQPNTCQEFGDYEGSLDDLRIYDRALSASEIAAFTPAVATTSALVVPSAPVTHGSVITYDVTVTPPPSTRGTVRFYEVDGDERTQVGVWTTDPFTGIARLVLSAEFDSYPGIGRHAIEAEFEGAGGYQSSATNLAEFEVIKNPMSLSLTSSSTSLYPDQDITLTATASPWSPVPVEFWATSGGQPSILLGTESVASQRATLTLSPLALGDYDVVAVVPETATWSGATSNSVHFVYAKRPTSIGIAAFGVKQTHHPWQISLSPSVLGPGAVTRLPTGTVTLFDGSTSLGTQTLTAGWAEFAVPSFSVGTHNLTATYDGDAYYAGSDSDVEAIVIGPDTVDATGVGVEYTSVYPVTDGYRDTVAIRGTRAEPISVSIRIYSPTGSSVKSISIARASGTYSTRWNGRNSAGTILASGKYKVVQTLTDAYGTKKTYTNYVALSRKKLVTYTKYIEKAGNAVTAKGSGSGGAVSTSSTNGYVKLAAGNGWALAGWEFYIPSATVYKSIAFQVYAKAGFSAPATQIGMQNFTTCPRTSGTWYDTCFERWKGIGNSTKSLTWYTTSGSSSSASRSGRYVRGMIDVEVGTVYVYKARARVVYAVLE